MVTADGIVKRASQIDYSGGRPIVCTVPETVPYAFLEAIQVGDYSLASSYLTLAMKREVDEEHLAEFFGEILYFYPIDLTHYAVKTKQEKRVFEFTLRDNKIEEISE